MRPTDDPVVKEMIHRLKAPLDTVEWNVDRGFALGRLLEDMRLEFEDGFVFNGDDSDSVVGRQDVAAILSELCLEPRMGWHDWYSLVGSNSRAPEDLDALLDELRVRLLIVVNVTDYRPIKRVM